MARIKPTWLVELTRRPPLGWCLTGLAVVALTLCVTGQSGQAPSLTYVPGSSVKVEQVIGDCDWQYLDYTLGTGSCRPTTSQTVTRAHVLGNGQGGSFEHNGKLIFLFGDTISEDINTLNYHGKDPIAWSTSTDPEAGLLINFYMNSDNTPLFVVPPNVKMGPDDVPNSGISLNDGIYLLANIGSDTSLENPQANDYSILIKFDEQAQTFAAGRTVSKLPGGHFIFTSMHKSGADVLMFGAGSYRASDIYLSTTPAISFQTGAGTRYFAGLVNGQPKWSDKESDSVPVVQDNPLNGPAWPNDNPTVGNLSVIHNDDLGLWLMTYDGGRQETTRNNDIKGTYFTYAQQPWGPWAAPQLIFSQTRDKAYGVWVHNPSIKPDPPGDGLHGPLIGVSNGANVYSESGGAFAPLMIERFTRVSATRATIYYNISPWNPYTVVRMRSDFTIQGCVYILGPHDVSFPKQGGTATITVTTASGCSWSVENLPSWVTLTSRGSGTGPGSVAVQLFANSGTDRSGSFSIAGRTITIQQSAK